MIKYTTLTGLNDIYRRVYTSHVVDDLKYEDSPEVRFRYWTKINTYHPGVNGTFVISDTEQEKTPPAPALESGQNEWGEITP